MEKLIADIKKHAQQIRADEWALFLVIGTGGSLNGSKAVHNALGGGKRRETGTYLPIQFLGDELTLDGYMKHLDLNFAKESKWNIYINYISKSGDTLEPKLIFDYLYEKMQVKYTKDELKQQIIVTTDVDSPLHKRAEENGWKTYFIPSNVGGRYSVFTPAGLLPIAVAGHDVGAFFEGGRNSAKIYRENPLKSMEEHLARTLHAHTIGETLQKCDINLFTFFKKDLESLGAWLCQLFNESCGKDGKGIFSDTAIYPRELHSLGQMVQDGRRNLVETFISFQDMYDCKQFGRVNRAIYDATFKAHTDGDVPVIEVKVEKLDEFHLGGLMQLMMDSCVRYCQLLGVNPFDQPGVEKYKEEIRKIL